MVKRTVGVLGVLSLVLMMAGTSMAFFPGPACFGGAGEGLCAPPQMYVPVPCPAPIQKTIVKKWQVKIVGPCPPVSGPACGNNNAFGRGDGEGLLLSLAKAIPSPFDFLVSVDGVYGCLGGKGGCGSPCGTCAGPLANVFGSFGAMPFTFFGGLW